MTSLVLNLSKPGDQVHKLQLNLRKSEIFVVKLSWEEKNPGEQTDLDLHAIHTVNTGGGAKASSMEDILSTYNVRRRIGGQDVGTLAKKADGSFEIHGGALVHSPDALDGSAEGDEDEWIRVDPSKLSPPASGHIEIPLVAMIHKASNRKFADVKNARVSVVSADGGAPLMSATLSNEFGQFVGVQMGSIMIDAQGTASFAAVGVGFGGDFNAVLAHFS